MQKEFVTFKERLRVALEKGDTENLSKLLKENKYICYSKIDYMIERAILNQHLEAIKLMREYYRDNQDEECEFNLLIVYESIEEIEKFFQKYNILLNLKDVLTYFYFFPKFF